MGSSLLVIRVDVKEKHRNELAHQLRLDTNYPKRNRKKILPQTKAFVQSYIKITDYFFAYFFRNIYLESIFLKTF